MSDTISNDEVLNLISFGEGRSNSPAPVVQGTALPSAASAPASKSKSESKKAVDVTAVPAPVVAIPQVQVPQAPVATSAPEIAKTAAEQIPAPVPPNPIETAQQSLGINLNGNVLPFVAGAGAGAVLAYSASKLKDRIQQSKAATPARIEPTMAPEPVSAPANIVPPQQTTATPVQAAEERLKSMQAAKAAQAPRPGPVAPPAAPLPPGATFADLAAMSAPQATVQPITTALDEVTKPVAPTAAPESKKPVKPTVDVSGLTKEQAGMKRYLVAQYGGGDAGEAAYKQVVSILGEPPAYEKGKGGGLTGEQLGKVKEWRKESIPGPKINLTHEMKSTFKDIAAGKVAKGAGALSVLATIPGFAEAAQKGDWAKVTDMLTDFIVPPFAGSSQLAPGTLDGRPDSAKMMELSPVPGVGAGRGFVNPPLR